MFNMGSTVQGFGKDSVREVTLSSYQMLVHSKDLFIASQVIERKKKTKRKKKGVWNDG